MSEGFVILICRESVIFMWLSVINKLWQCRISTRLSKGVLSSGGLSARQTDAVQEEQLALTLASGLITTAGPADQYFSQGTQPLPCLCNQEGLGSHFFLSLPSLFTSIVLAGPHSNQMSGTSIS